MEVNNKIKCVNCDSMILPETAKRNEGLCAPCIRKEQSNFEIKFRVPSVVIVWVCIGVGAGICGPLAPIGGIIGYLVGLHFVDKRDGGSGFPYSAEAYSNNVSKKNINEPIVTSETSFDDEDPSRFETLSRHRITHCWNCKTFLNNDSNTECSSCGWIKCPNCDSCGCNYYR